MAEHNNFSGGFISPMLQDLPEIPTSSTTSEFLRLKIISGHNLPNADVGFGNKSDPYVKIHAPNHAFIPKKTKIKKNTLNPKWDEEFLIKVSPGVEQKILLEVFDYDHLTSDDFLGKVELNLDNMLKESVGISLSNTFYDLKTKDSKPGKGRIEVYHAFIDTTTMDSRTLDTIDFCDASSLVGIKEKDKEMKKKNKKKKKGGKLKIDFSSGSSEDDDDNNDDDDGDEDDDDNDNDDEDEENEIEEFIEDVEEFIEDVKDFVEDVEEEVEEGGDDD